MAKVGLEPSPATPLFHSQLRELAARADAESGAPVLVEQIDELSALESDPSCPNSGDAPSHLFTLLLGLLTQLPAAERARLAAALQAADEHRKGGT